MSTRGLTVILGTIAALGAAAIDMYLPSLPAIERDTGAAPGAVQLTLSAFLLGLAVGQLIYGPISDVLGRRRILTIGVSVYCAAGLGCVLAVDIEQLILARFVQALGAASGMVITRAMVRDLYELDAAARAQSFINMAFLMTPLLAPVIGGYVLIWYGWRAIFVVLVLLGAVSLVAQILFVPETLAPERRTRLSVAALLKNYGAILSQRQSVGCMLTSAFAFACMFVYFSFSPFVFIELFGVAEQHYGYLFALNVLGLMAASFLNARLVLAHGALRMLRRGSMISAASGLILLAVSLLMPGSLAGIVIPLVFVIGCLGLIGGNAIAGALAPFPHLAATTASLFGFCQMTLAGIVGIVASYIHDGTALPMTAAIAVLSVTGLISGLLLIRHVPDRR